jgi:DNA polymerase-2
MKYRVIYGDTDSLFVLSHHPEDPGSCFAEGAALAATINGELARYVESEYGVHSRLELEFEKVYRHFFLPALRTQGGTVADGEPRRGRAKGYAGLIAENPESTTGGSSRLEVKGMEAVRRDWTPLAQEFQLTILRTLFDEQPIAERSARLIETIRILVRKLRAGDFDNEIVYSRSLRKMVSDYTKSQPPHVKAALLLPPSERQGTIRYVMTLEGPQPVNRRTAPIDYDHYVEKQLRPIALAFSESLGPDIARALDSDQQLTLFGS